MSNPKDRHWLLPLVLITVATLAVYAIYVVSDLRTAHDADTYQVTVEQESELPSPVDSTPTTDSASADNDTTIDSDMPGTNNVPSADNATSDNNILHATDVPEGSYIGNKNSEKYHRFDCEYGAMVQDNNLIVFDTLEDAINSGYKPCGACHPDE